MHQSVMEWGERMVTLLHLSNKPVLDWGSNSSNGSFRSLFTGKYVGADLTDGPGVDLFPRDIETDCAYMEPVPRVIVCTEVLEHVLRPWRALDNLRAHATAECILLLTCRGYDERGCWPVHEHPIDVWRFSARSLDVTLRDAGWRPLRIDPDPEGPGWLVVAQ